MAYQRWDKPGRHYVWMGNDGLHIWPTGCNDQNGGFFLGDKDVADRDNAAAILRGCFDLLTSLGIEVKIKKGEISIERKSK